MLQGLPTHTLLALARLNVRPRRSHVRESSHTPSSYSYACVLALPPSTHPPCTIRPPRTRLSPASPTPYTSSTTTNFQTTFPARRRLTSVDVLRAPHPRVPASMSALVALSPLDVRPPYTRPCALRAHALADATHAHASSAHLALPSPAVPHPACPCALPSLRSHSPHPRAFAPAMLLYI